MQHTLTYEGLHQWYKAMFEHLGWMLLAERDGAKSKLAQYKLSIMDLKDAIEQKHAGTHDVDRKADLMILHANVMTLWAHVSKDFKVKTAKRS